MEDEPTEQEFFEPQEQEVFQGLLYEKPQASDLHVALQMLFLCVIFTVLHHSAEARDLFWLSGKSIFVDQQYWRLVTSLFVHSSVEHLLANSLLFMFFAWYLKSYYGRWAFPGLALVVGVLANLATIMTYPPQVRLVGASGMVYGMVAMWVSLYIYFERRRSLYVKVFRSLGFLLVLMVPSKFSPKTSYLAHLFGFGFGVVASLAVIPEARKKEAVLAKKFERLHS